MKTGLPSLFVSERPRKKRSVSTAPKNKHDKHRQKCISEGRCPHCGKTCAPYRECQERRTLKRIYHGIGKMIASGEIIRVSRGVYRKLAAGVALKPCEHDGARSTTEKLSD